MFSKVWKPSPLPLSFHIALEGGNWQDALEVYQAHPFHAPPADTYELLKTLLYKTNLKVSAVQERFDTRMKTNESVVRRAPEPVEWGRYWAALNSGDSKVISMGLSGAKVSGVSAQTGVAEACAVLLTSVGKNWKADLVDNVPFSTVTKNNLITSALQRQRWDIALEMVAYGKVSRSDMNNIWPMMSTLPWQVGLQFTTKCQKNAVSYDVVLPLLLETGCHLQTLSDHLESVKVLSNFEVIAPLVDHAMEAKEYDYLNRMMDHLEDIGLIPAAVLKVWQHLCETESPAIIVERVKSCNMKLYELTVNDLEEISSMSS